MLPQLPPRLRRGSRRYEKHPRFSNQNAGSLERSWRPIQQFKQIEIHFDSKVVVHDDIE